MTEETKGGRVFFSSTGRTFGEEDELCVLSVGVDIGSSTSHLVFSRIMLERLDSRYVVTERESFYQSDILLTPYSAEEEIDAEALGAFIARQYKDAKIDPDEIDTGALILTGVAVRRRNARRIGELFAAQAGKMVAVSAGDSLETVMAAYGSGAAARSIRAGASVMNVDVGGGTSKIAVCADGKVTECHRSRRRRASRFVIDGDRRIVRIEEAGRRFGTELGLKLEPGVVFYEQEAQQLAAHIADAPVRRHERRLAARRRRGSTMANFLYLVRSRIAQSGAAGARRAALHGVEQCVGHARGELLRIRFGEAPCRVRALIRARCRSGGRLPRCVRCGGRRRSRPDARRRRPR